MKFCFQLLTTKLQTQFENALSFLRSRGLPQCSGECFPGGVEQPTLGALQVIYVEALYLLPAVLPSPPWPPCL